MTIRKILGTLALSVLFPATAWAGGFISFEERVRAQEAIERVYYNHQVWPKENPAPKPPLEDAIPREAIEAKVRFYLSECAALDQLWRRPISAGQLQTEMDRMARESRDPEMLQELFSALGNDPTLIAECLARPILADRLARSWYAFDGRFHGGLQQKALKAAASMGRSGFSSATGGETQPVLLKRVPEESPETEDPMRSERRLGANEFAREVAQFPEEGAPASVEETFQAFLVRQTYRRTSGELAGGVIRFPKRDFREWFSEETTLFPDTVQPLDYAFSLPAAFADRGRLEAQPSSPDSWQHLWYLPENRSGHTAVWTGTEMIVWGGTDGSDYQATGGRYTPATDTWAPMSASGAPSARESHTAVWSGEEMIIWGGYWSDTTSSAYLNTGGRYNPTSDTWTPTPTAGAPVGRRSHTAIWTGNEMVVWGGLQVTGGLTYHERTGGVFNLGDNSWSATTLTNAPTGRENHTAVWNGTEMIVWGGSGAAADADGLRKQTGGRYHVTANSWTATPSPGVTVEARAGHTAVWSGSEMIVWGGYTATSYTNTGGRYSPTAGTWTATSTTSCPAARYLHTAVWAGTRMIVWGGQDTAVLNTGSRYYPASDSWSSMTTTGAPAARETHTAVWTGQEMIIWGGYAGGRVNTGGRYDPYNGTWVATSIGANVPTGRDRHTAVWTGSKFIIWGGYSPGAGGTVNTGGQLDPATTAWTATSTGANCPSPRNRHSAIWTGSEMIVWGGYGCTDPPTCSTFDQLNTGGRYIPTTDTWTATSTAAPVPAERDSHTAVWTGTQMVVWGGYNGSYLNTGGRYTPGSTWVATSTGTNCPTARSGHTAIWTGSKMVIWGGWEGASSAEVNTGGVWDSTANTWAATATTGAPVARQKHGAVWADSRMVVWGGHYVNISDDTIYLNSGSRYNPPPSNTWESTSDTGAPAARNAFTAFWTGTEMIAWGGYNGIDRLNTGGLYKPDTNIWRSIPVPPPEFSRANYAGVWTGEFFIFWDGNPVTASGGIYYPNTPPVAAINHVERAAAYYAPYGCPRCSSYGSSCNSGATLLAGRDTISGGAEPNQPNTIGSTCADGTTGTYHSDESIEQIRVVSTDGGYLTQGLQAQIEVTVWAYSTFTSDHLDLYYATSPTNPTWTYITTLTPTGAGLQTLTATYTLPAGYLWQAVRAQFRFGGVAGNPGDPCLVGEYIDRDDLVFPTYAPFSMGVTSSYNIGSTGSSSGSNPFTTTPYSDKLDSIVSYEWDFNGDAGFGTDCDTASGTGVDYTGSSVTLTLSALQSLGIASPGNHTYWLRVTDEGGLRDCVSGTLPVTDGIAPTVTVVTPNGGESWDYSPATTDRRNHLIVWEANDNFPPMGRVKLSYTTDGTTWTCIADSAGTTCPAAGLTPAVGFYDWSMPTKTEATAAGQIFPSVNAKIRVEVWDTSGNAASDQSDTPFYIIQPTAGAVQTLLVTHMGRLTTLYGATAANQVYDKLLELSTHDKVLGTVLDLANAPSLTTPYADWVADPTSVAKANAVADAARAYLVTQLTSTYTNAKFLVIAGDDRVVPHRRVPDSTLTYPETQYVGQVDCASTVGSAICANHYLTDATYGDLAYETTGAGSLWLALPDLAVGRLVETPAQMMDTVASFIAQNGQVSLNEVLVTGYDFLEDSATAMRDAWLSGGETVDSRLGTGWTSTDLENDLFSSPPHALHNLNDHSDHYTFGTPSGLLTAAQMDTHAGRPLEGSLFYNVGCHSGLSVPPSFANALDLPELMLEKGAAAYVGNTGFGWGLRYGIGYSERLMQLITARLLSQPSYALGTALSDAKRDYFLENHRYDVFDEKSLMESTLYGLPMYEVVVDPASLRVPEKPLSATGPDRQTSGGITALKALSTEALPPGVIQLDLNFDFSAGGVYVKHTTPSGSYYSLSGKTGGEIGDSVQPLFTYDSRLSGTLSHGVVFTGGTYASESGFNPVVGAPASNNPDLGEGPIGPMAGSYIPTVNATHPTLFSFAARGGDGTSSAPLAGATDLTQMTVYTGYIQADVESRFTQMAFTIYYSTSSDKTAPAITDPGPGGDLHDLSGVTCSFSVPASDASGVFRVLVLYDAGLGLWKSLDLAYDAGLARWTGPLELARSTRYVVYAVDNAGNVGYLKDTGSDLDGAGQPTGSTYQGARVFEATLPAGDTDGDGMPDVYEDAHGLDKLVNDAALDPDYDGFANLAEYGATTDPQNPDSDSDGDNDGSEAHNGRNPLNPADGKAVTILAAKSGGDIVISWPPGTGQNALIDGPYWIYRSPDPLFDYQELRPTAPMPLPDGVATWTDTGAAADGQPKYYYAVSNVAAPAPVVDVLSPATGPAAGGTTVNLYGAHFVAPCTVSFGGTPATNVVVVTNTTITCRTPAHAAGAVNVVVTGPSGRTGTKTGGFTYTP